MLTLASVSLLPVAEAAACTAFLLERGEERVLAKSYDWSMGQGLVVFNKRGVSKRALGLMPGDRPARWVSRHASLTFNQYGRELPNGGINEAGLMVEVLWLSVSKYPRVDARPTVNELQWIQYQLDRFETVDEMLGEAHQLRVSLVHGKVHYLACDRTGRCATFEHLGGRMVVTPGARVLANHTRAASEDHRRALGEQRPAGWGSLARYARAARCVAAPPREGSLVDAAFAALDDVRGPTTRWQIVHDPVARRVHFRTRRSPGIKHIDLAALGDPGCTTPVRTLDIDVETAASQDVTERMVSYRRADNHRLLARSLAPLGRRLQTRLPPLLGPLLARRQAERLVARVASYPDTLGCTLPTSSPMSTPLKATPR